MTRRYVEVRRTGASLDFERAPVLGQDAARRRRRRSEAVWRVAAGVLLFACGMITALTLVH